MAAEKLLSVLRSDIDKDIRSVMSMSDTTLIAICQNNCISVKSNDKCLGVLFYYYVLQDLMLISISFIKFQLGVEYMKHTILPISKEYNLTGCA